MLVNGAKLNVDFGLVKKQRLGLFSRCFGFCCFVCSGLIEKQG
jgi:hypothetical protein